MPKGSLLLACNKTRPLMGKLTPIKPTKTLNYWIKNLLVQDQKRKGKTDPENLARKIKERKINTEGKINLKKSHEIQKTKDRLNDPTNLKVLKENPELLQKTPMLKHKKIRGTIETKDENQIVIKVLEGVKTEISLMKNNNILAIALLASILWASTACNNGRVYESYQDLEKLEWVVTDTISFSLDSLETNTGTSSILSIRYDDKYEYNNLYVRYFLKDSTREILSDTLLNLQLFDPKTGKPLGQGYGNRRILYDTLPGNRVLPKSSYHFVQYMRKDTLSGIESVGLKINANN